MAIYSAKTIGLSLIIHLNDCQKWNWTQPSSSVPPFLLSPLLSLLLSALLSPSSLFSPPPTSSPSSTQINFSLHSRPSFEQPALTGVDQDMLSSNLLLSTKVAWIHLSMTTGLCLWPLMHVSYAVNTPVQGSTGPEPTLTISFWVALVVAGVGGCFKRKKTWFFFYCWFSSDKELESKEWDKIIQWTQLGGCLHTRIGVSQEKYTRIFRKK